MDIIGGFVANAVAVKIDVDAARIAGVRTIGHLKAIGHQAAAIVGGQLVHVIKHTADRLGQIEAGAVGGLGCLGHDVVKTGHLQQLFIVAVAAGSQQRGGGAVFHFAHFHTGAFSILHHQLGYRAVEHKLNTAFFNGLVQTIGKGIEVIERAAQTGVVTGERYTHGVKGGAWHCGVSSG